MVSSKTYEERVTELAGKKLASTLEEYREISQAADSPFVRTHGEWGALLKQGNHPLVGCAAADVEAFTKGLKFKKGALAHANYNMLADKISFMQFKELMAIFGVSMKLFSALDNYYCQLTGAEMCKPSNGYVCFPENCHM